jgi:hypothetical protein
VVSKKSSKPRTPTKQKPEQAVQAPAKEPETICLALASIAQKLLVVSGWDRSEDDAQHINDLADRCIGLLVALKTTASRQSERKNSHAA